MNRRIPTCVLGVAFLAIASSVKGQDTPAPSSWLLFRGDAQRSSRVAKIVAGPEKPWRRSVFSEHDDESIKYSRRAKELIDDALTREARMPGFFPVAQGNGVIF